MESRKSTLHDLIATRLREANKCGHAIASTLRGKKGLIEHYELFRFPIPKQPSEVSSNNPQQQQPIAAALIKVGNQLDGPIGKVHGGIIALLYDDIMSFSCAPLLRPCVTGNLAVQYKVPTPHDTFLVVRVYVDDAKTAEYHKEQAAAAAANNNSNTTMRKKRVFLRATCSSLGSSTVETAVVSPDDGVVYSTATITMVQVKTRPPSARGDAMQPKKLVSRL